MWSSYHKLSRYQNHSSRMHSPNEDRYSSNVLELQRTVEVVLLVVRVRFTGKHPKDWDTACVSERRHKYKGLTRVTLGRLMSRRARVYLTCCDEIFL